MTSILAENTTLQTVTLRHLVHVAEVAALYTKRRAGKALTKEQTKTLAAIAATALTNYNHHKEVSKILAERREENHD